MLKGSLLTKLKLAKDTIQFNFALTAGELIFKPGQFLSIKLPKVRTHGDEGNVRYFSLVSSPDDSKRFSIATRLTSSAFKQALFSLNLGEEVEIGGVGGAMILPEVVEGPLVFIAGGIGITPFMSMLTFARAHQSGQQITLLYSNRNRTTVAFLDELEKLAEAWPEFKLITTMTDDDYWPGEKRPIDHEFIKEYINDYKGAKYFVAGPSSMVLAMANNFDRLGITKEHFILEEFFGY
jgi:ferredoxin-NADP reductase